jgi:hypothetical protein
MGLIFNPEGGTVGWNSMYVICFLGHRSMIYPLILPWSFIPYYISSNIIPVDSFIQSVFFGLPRSNSYDHIMGESLDI